MNRRKRPMCNTPKPRFCPSCHQPFNVARAMNNGDRALPKPGDMSVCDSCFEPCIYGPNGIAQPLTAEDMAYLKENNTVMYDAIEKTRADLKAVSGMKTHQARLDAKCPKCGSSCDMATNADDQSREPQPDDFSVCFQCGEINVYADDLSLKSLTPGDWAEREIIDPELVKEVRAFQQKVIEFRKRPRSPFADPIKDLVVCPGCNAELPLRVATNDANGRPDEKRPGNVGVCGACAVAFQWNDDLIPIVMSDYALEELGMDHPREHALIVRIREAIAEKNRQKGQP